METNISVTTTPAAAAPLLFSPPPSHDDRATSSASPSGPPSTSHSTLSMMRLLEGDADTEGDADGNAEEGKARTSMKRKADEDLSDSESAPAPAPTAGLGESVKQESAAHEGAVVKDSRRAEGEGNGAVSTTETTEPCSATPSHDDDDDGEDDDDGDDDDDDDDDDDELDQLSLKDRLILSLRELLFGPTTPLNPQQQQQHHHHHRHHHNSGSRSHRLHRHLNSDTLTSESAPCSPRSHFSLSASSLDAPLSLPSSARTSPVPLSPAPQHTSAPTALPSRQQQPSSETAAAPTARQRPAGLKSRIEVHPHGGASVVHVYPEDMELLGPQERQLFAEACLEEILSEDPRTNLARHVIGIIHQGGAQLPNLFRLLTKTHPSTSVVREIFGQKNTSESTKIQDYVAQVDATLSHGTHRAGGMRPISMVGCFQEEQGGYFPDLIAIMEDNPFLRVAMPWGPISVCQGMHVQSSNDGPIMWVRPGEQVVSLSDLAPCTPEKGKGGSGETSRRKRNVLDSLQIRPRVESPREKLVEDRTGCHADHAGLFPYRHTVAAVGLLQPVSHVVTAGRASTATRAMQLEDARAKGDTARLHNLELEERIFTDAAISGKIPTGHSHIVNRLQLEPAPVIDCKDVIAFHASDMQTVGETIGLDFNEEPADQLLDPQLWVEDAKLNQLRRSGVRYARVRLEEGDIYYIPRRVVHQFKTVAASVSVTWHLRYKRYKEFALGMETSEALQQASNNPGVGSSSSSSSGNGTGSSKPRKRFRMMNSMKSMR